MVENGKKHRQNSHLMNHCPTSEGVSEVSERANEWAVRRARAKRAVRSKRTSERCERTDERVAQYFSLYFWFIWPTVYPYPRYRWRRTPRVPWMPRFPPFSGFRSRPKRTSQHFANPTTTLVGVSPISWACIGSWWWSTWWPGASSRRRPKKVPSAPWASNSRQSPKKIKPRRWVSLRSTWMAAFSPLTRGFTPHLLFSFPGS